jgi:hypothetical protein
MEIYYYERKKEDEMGGCDAGVGGGCGFFGGL